MTPAAELIALETAMRDLARLYEVAVLFAPLRERAEQELLPRMSELGGYLRHDLRGGTLARPAIERAAAELQTLTARWSHALGDLRSSAPVVSAIDAFQRDDHAALTRLLPQVFAGLRAVTPLPHELHYAVSVAAPRRRRPGGRPFLTVADATEKIAACRHGIRPEPASDDWWELAFSALSLAEERETLDAPITLALDLRACGIAIFQAEDETTLRAYTACLVAPFTLMLGSAADDEWWEAAGESYAGFRDALAARARSSGITVRIV